MLPGINIRLRPKGFRQLSVTSVAVGLADAPDGIPTNVGPLAMVIIVVETASIRYRDDGIDPDASTGMLIAAGTVLEIAEDSLRRVKFIATSDTATLGIAYYG